MLVHDEGRLEGLQDLRGRASGVGPSSRRRKQHDELVAAEPGDRVDRAQDRAEPGSDLREHDVADRVPVGVVDLLETVEVDQQDGERTALAPGPPERLLETVVQEETVRQARQGVVQGLVLEGRDVLAALADVAQDGDPGNRTAPSGRARA